MTAPAGRVSRRVLLGSSALAAVLGPVLAPLEAFAAERTARRLYRRQRFRRLRRRTFRLTDGSRSWTVRLAAVADLPDGPRRDERCFSLVFTSKRALPPQDTYTLRRSGFVPTALFVVPVGQGGRTGEVIVNG
ncbi:MAG: hypothetical protein WBP61_16850 [Nocardioides sp.]